MVLIFKFKLLNCLKIKQTYRNLLAKLYFVLYYCAHARVVKSVDTGDLKSPAHKACQFESGLGHHFNSDYNGAMKNLQHSAGFFMRDYHQ